MLFVIIGRDGPKGKELRPLHRPAHLENLTPLVEAGRIVTAGPLTDGAGSLIVLEAESIDEVRKIAEKDPYTIHGVFESVEVHPYKQVFPAGG